MSSQDMRRCNRQGGRISLDATQGEEIAVLVWEAVEGMQLECCQ
jgi:hypothetical protein